MKTFHVGTGGIIELPDVTFNGYHLPTLARLVRALDSPIDNDLAELVWRLSNQDTLPYLLCGTIHARVWLHAVCWFPTASLGGAIMNRTRTYFKGNLAEYTGRSEWQYGQKWFEILMLEGLDKGKYKVVSLAHHDRDTAVGVKSMYSRGDA